MDPIRLPRAVIALEGPEARPFLDNLVTQDLEKLENAPCLYAGLLSPQGKVQADMLVWPAPGGLLIEADPARGADLLRRLTMFRLRAAIALRDVSETFAALAFLDAPGDAAAPDPRHPGLGWRALVPRASRGAYSDDVAAYHARRLAVGVPDLARDADVEEVFALEALFEELNGVDFRKGCFVGQENVSRMKRRATTRRKFCMVEFEGAPPPHGAPVRAGPAELGSVRSGGEGRAMALLRLDRAQEAQARGIAIEADGRALRLAPPSWLLMPEAG